MILQRLFFDSEFCCGYCSGLNKNKEKVQFNVKRMENSSSSSRYSFIYIYGGILLSVH